VVEEGEIVERGTHTELLESQGRYHKLYTYQSRI
jgi:subfamily B ATP-binding cassette protein MsbA